MKRLGYYLILPIIYLVACLPFGVLYAISDGLYLIVFHLFGYRKAVVMRNLQNAFPSRSDADHRKIAKSFYRHFCDLIVETIKTLTITPEQVKRRIDFDPTGAFFKMHEQNRSMIIAMGHFGNWELAGAGFAVADIHKLYVIYHPVKSPAFNALIYKMRTRLGNGLYAMSDAFRGMVRHRNELTATAFIADQTPHPDHALWLQWLNQDTPVFTGLGKISRKLNYPILYVSTPRGKRRGYHTVHAEVLIEEPQLHTEDEITERYMRRLEEDILQHPEWWLWSHRRWKHSRPLPSHEMGK